MIENGSNFQGERICLFLFFSHHWQKETGIATINDAISCVHALRSEQELMINKGISATFTSLFSLRKGCVNNRRDRATSFLSTITGNGKRFFMR